MTVYILQRFGRNNTSVGVAASRAFIFTGDKRQGERIFSNEPVYCIDVVFGDFHTRINFENLYIIRISFSEDKDAITFLHTVQLGKGIEIRGIQMVVSGQYALPFAG